MGAPLFTQLGKYYLALKLKWEHDKAINRTRGRWNNAILHPASPSEKRHK